MTRDRTLVGLLVFVSVVALAIAPSAAACNYYKCYQSETTATCSDYFCSGSGCNDAIYAARCEVTCDRMFGGGCFCDTRGTNCYEI